MRFLERNAVVGWYIALVSTVAAIAGILQLVGVRF